MVHAGGRPLASLIDDNFERLERVDNNSNPYYWKCKHCGDTDNSLGAQIQGRDNNLPNHLIKRCISATAPLRQAARLFIMEKTGNSVEPFETLGKIRANLRHHSAMKVTESGKPIRRRHAHMHTREEVGIAIETAQDLEASFAWAPPLSTEPRDTDDLLAGPESISPDDIAAEFAALEELKRTEEVQNINEVEVLEGNAFDFDELDRVEQGIIPQTVLDEVEVVNYNGEDGGWDEATLMSSLGMSYT